MDQTTKRFLSDLAQQKNSKRNNTGLIMRLLSRNFNHFLMNFLVLRDHKCLLFVILPKNKHQILRPFTTITLKSTRLLDELLIHFTTNELSMKTMSQLLMDQVIQKLHLLNLLTILISNSQISYLVLDDVFEDLELSPKRHSKRENKKFSIIKTAASIAKIGQNSEHLRSEKDLN